MAVTANAAQASYENLRSLALSDLRLAIREGRYAGHTAGLGDGFLQCNLAIFSEAYAVDFFRFCQRNPKACPLVGVSDTGDPMMRTLGADIDVRSDLPGYNVYRQGELAEQRADIRDLWRDDFVAFALGCSFTFERALIDAGIPVRHIEDNLTAPMYRTSVETVPAGPFGGSMVVSMRPIPREDVARARDISARYPLAHGGPVQIGAPAAIGVTNLARPDWGDPVPVLDGETPVFWACGVTPQNALMHAKPPICITHTPGRMLITDVPEDAEVPVLSTTNWTNRRAT